MATQTELARKYHLSIRGYMGQHLLIDPNMQIRIVNLAEIRPGDLILEIGPGLGALTGKILEKGCELIAIEKDKNFVRVLDRELGRQYGGRFKLYQSDILKSDLNEIFQKTGWRGKKRVKVIGNLPYYITAPILFHLLDAAEWLDSAVLTMQKEVANRILAEPGDKDYGRLTLALRFRASARHGWDIPPDCFRPRPAVHSSVLKFQFCPGGKSAEGVSWEFLSELVRTAFAQRRKTLVAVLSRARWIKSSREKIVNIFKNLGMKPTVRAEELSDKDFAALAQALSRDNN